METREKEIFTVTIAGAVANIALALFKLLAGIIGRSGAMIADAVHSFSDLVSDVVVLVMVKVASKGEDRSHDYGHGKFETLATAIIAFLLLAVAVRLMTGSVQKIVDIVNGKTTEVPGMIALTAALVSIFVKEVLYQWTAKVGKSNGSEAVIANAWHHRSDALSSIAAAAGIGVAIIFGGKWVVMDPLTCCMISVVIGAAAIRMAIPALHELTEGSLPDSTEKEICRIVDSIEGVHDIHALKTRKMGPDIVIEAHLVVDPDMRVADAHELTDMAESKLREKYGPGTHISLHIEPE